MGGAPVVDSGGPGEVDLLGFIDQKRGGIRTTFATVPDVPVTKFTFNLFGGKKGLLVNSENLDQLQGEESRGGGRQGEEGAVSSARASTQRRAFLAPLGLQRFLDRRPESCLH